MIQTLRQKRDNSYEAKWAQFTCSGAPFNSLEAYHPTRKAPNRRSIDRMISGDPREIFNVKVSGSGTRSSAHWCLEFLFDIE